MTLPSWGVLFPSCFESVGLSGNIDSVEAESSAPAPQGSENNNNNTTKLPQETPQTGDDASSVQSTVHDPRDVGVRVSPIKRFGDVVPREDGSTVREQGSPERKSAREWLLSLHAAVHHA